MTPWRNLFKKFPTKVFDVVNPNIQKSQNISLSYERHDGLAFNF